MTKKNNLLLFQAQPAEIITGVLNKMVMTRNTQPAWACNKTVVINYFKSPSICFFIIVCVCVYLQQISRIHSVAFCYWIRVLQCSMKLIHTIHTDTWQEVDHSYSLTQDIEKINSLKTKKFIGVQWNLYEHFKIKRLFLLVLPYIIYFINFYHQESSLLVFKYPIIKPLFKKGERNNTINYRPTSLLTSFSKALENVTCGRLLHHINANNILVSQQFGFQIKSSTETAFFKLLNNILNALNNKLMVGGIFWDLEKAFDYVNHDILLSQSFME